MVKSYFYSTTTKSILMLLIFYLDLSTERFMEASVSSEIRSIVLIYGNAYFYTIDNNSNLKFVNIKAYPNSIVEIDLLTKVDSISNVNVADFVATQGTKLIYGNRFNQAITIYSSLDCAGEPLCSISGDTDFIHSLYNFKQSADIFAISSFKTGPLSFQGDVFHISTSTFVITPIFQINYPPTTTKVFNSGNLFNLFSLVNHNNGESTIEHYMLDNIANSVTFNSTFVIPDFEIEGIDKSNYGAKGVYFFGTQISTSKSLMYRIRTFGDRYYLINIPIGFGEKIVHFSHGSGSDFESLMIMTMRPDFSYRKIHVMSIQDDATFGTIRDFFALPSSRKHTLVNNYVFNSKINMLVSFKDLKLFMEDTLYCFSDPNDPYTNCNGCKEGEDPNLCTNCGLEGVYQQTNFNCDTLYNYGSCENPCTVTNCRLCPGDHSICIECKNSMRLWANTCLNTCPIDTFDQTGICIQCSEFCTNCASPTTCAICDTGYFIYEGKCTNQCPLGTYRDNSQCLECHQSCKSCFTGNSCIQCKENYLLIVGSALCQPICQNDEYLDNTGQQCVRCLNLCASCSGPLSCTECSVGYYFDRETSECLPKLQLESTSFDPLTHILSLRFNATLSINEAYPPDCLSVSPRVDNNDIKISIKSASISFEALELLLSIDGPTLQSTPFLIEDTDYSSDNKALCSVSDATKTKKFEDYPVFFSISRVDDSYMRVGLLIAAIMKSTFQAMSLLLVQINPSNAFTLFKLFQMVDYLLYLDYPLPANLQNFLELLNINFFDYFPNIFRVSEKEGECYYPPKIEKVGNSCHLFNDIGSKLFIFLFLIPLKIIVEIIQKLLTYIIPSSKKSNSSYIAAVLRFCSSWVSVSTIFGIFVMAQVDILLSIAIQSIIFEPILVTTRLVGYFLSILIIIIYLGLCTVYLIIGKSLYRSNERRKLLEGMGKRWHSFIEVFEDLNLKKSFGLLVHVLFILKDLVLPFGIILGIGFPGLQISFLIFGSVLFNMYLIIIRPFKFVQIQIAMIIIESVSLLYLSILALLVYMEDAISYEFRYYFIGYPVIFLITTQLIFNICAMAFEILKEISKYFHQKKTESLSKSAVTPENKTEIDTKRKVKVEKLSKHFKKLSLGRSSKNLVSSKRYLMVNKGYYSRSRNNLDKKVQKKEDLQMFSEPKVILLFYEYF